MPFVEIDWSRYNSVGGSGIHTLTRNLETILQDVSRPCRFLLTAIGSYLEYKRPEKLWQRRLAVGHSVLVVLLVFLISIPGIFSLRLLPISTDLTISSAKTFGLYIYYIQALASSIFVVLLQLTSFSFKFRRQLDNATTGVGTVHSNVGKIGCRIVNLLQHL